MFFKEKVIPDVLDSERVNVEIDVSKMQKALIGTPLPKVQKVELSRNGVLMVP